MKKIEQEKAKILRKDKGLSIRQISKILGVSVGSVSSWVKDIELSKEQKEKLLNQNPAFSKMTLYSRSLSQESLKKRNETYRQRRIEFQEQGRQKAKQKSWLHSVGCMLYWAEGSKGKNSLVFCNSDIEMMKLFIRFLKEEMKITSNEISFSINVYLENGFDVKQIEQYWLDQLVLPKECLRKTIINSLPKSSQGYKKINLFMELEDW